MRPQRISAEMVGLVSTGRRAKAQPPKTDPLLTGLVAGFGGLMFPAVRLAQPARGRFAPGPAGDADFEAHLAQPRQRIVVGERNARSKLQREPNKMPDRGALYRDGKPLSWLDLRTLRCAGCRRALLGPSDEPVRADAVRRGSRGARAVKNLPPPVAGRVCDRPVCSSCFLGGA